MASAVSSSSDDYKQQHDIVLEEKEKNSVTPQNMYKLAALLARWNSNGKLPVCLLCRDVSKKITQLGHVFPHSVLKEGAFPLFFDFVRGAEGGVSRMGYHAFCEDCEKVFQQGEDHFNPCFFQVLNEDPASKINVTVKLADNKFPWLYYCLISIIWRASCFVPLNSRCIQVLECLRRYLLDWKTVEVDSKVKLFLFVPNDEIDKKIENDDENKDFFYKMFHFSLLGTPEISEDPNFLCAWLFCGPLHVLMMYSEENFNSYKGNEEFEEWELLSMLTTATDKFTIGKKTTRIFPVKYYDDIVKIGNNRLSATTRLPSAGKQLTSSSPVMQGTELLLLPKDVSYNSSEVTFAFNADIYKERENIVNVGAGSRFKIDRVKRGTEKIIFVAVKGGLENGGDLAMGLNVNDDGTVQYMKGVHIPASVVGVDLTQPPFKEVIETLVFNRYKI